MKSLLLRFKGIFKYLLAVYTVLISILIIALLITQKTNLVQNRIAPANTPAASIVKYIDRKIDTPTENCSDNKFKADSKFVFSSGILCVGTDKISTNLYFKKDGEINRILTVDSDAYVSVDAVETGELIVFTLWNEQRPAIDSTEDYAGAYVLNPQDLSVTQVLKTNEAYAPSIDKNSPSALPVALWVFENSKIQHDGKTYAILTATDCTGCDTTGRDILIDPITKRYIQLDDSIWNGKIINSNSILVSKTKHASQEISTLTNIDFPVIFESYNFKTLNFGTFEINDYNNIKLTNVDAMKVVGNQYKDKNMKVNYPKLVIETEHNYWDVPVYTDVEPKEPAFIIRVNAVTAETQKL